MVSEICKAKDPRTCPYHGALMRMYEAQAKGDFTAYFTERQKIEDLQKHNWEDDVTNLGLTLPTPQPVADPIAIVRARRTTELVTLMGSGQRIHAHKENECAGRYCAIHNPSDHPLNGAPLIWRNRMMERQCPHGVGHPDPDDVRFRVEIRGEDPAYASTHGCDGCCGDAAYTATQAGQPIRTPADNHRHAGLNIVPVEDARVQAGVVFDKIEVPDPDNNRFSMVFTRATANVEADNPDYIRIQANRPITDDEMEDMAEAVGYQSKAILAIQNGLQDPIRDTPYSFLIGKKDTTDHSRRTDVVAAYRQFEQSLLGMIRDGSPTRRTDRKGPGTAGTKLVNGIDDPNFGIEIYYNSVK